MSAVHVVNDDKLFKSWIDSHPEGFVLNANKKPSVKYLMLHTARCPQWRTGLPMTTTTYSKVVGPTVDSLRDWMAAQGFPRNLRIVNGEGCNCLKHASL